MPSARKHSRERFPVIVRIPPLVPVSMALVAVLLLLSGCGGSAAPPASATAGGSAASFGHGFIAFASCMRSHGLSGYPDPRITSSAHQWRVTISPGDTHPGSPAYQTAQDACRRLLPAGGAPAPARGAEQQQDLAFADCMRSHGVPDFPDADRDGAFTLPSTVNQQAPQYTRAATACASVQPKSVSILQPAPAG